MGALKGLRVRSELRAVCDRNMQLLGFYFSFLFPKSLFICFCPLLPPPKCIFLPLSIALNKPQGFFLPWLMVTTMFSSATHIHYTLGGDFQFSATVLTPIWQMEPIARPLCSLLTHSSFYTSYNHSPESEDKPFQKQSSLSNLSLT